MSAGDVGESVQHAPSGCYLKNPYEANCDGCPDVDGGCGRLPDPFYEDEWSTIYHADNADVLPALAGRARLIFTSPPYNLGDGSFAKMTRNGSSWNPKRSRWANSALARGYADHTDDMPYEEYVAWQQAVLSACWDALTDDGAIFYNHKPRPWDKGLRLPLALNPDLPLRQIITWDRAKGGINANPTHYVPTYEWVLIFAKPDWRLIDKSASHASDMWRVFPDVNNPHPAPFPVSLPAKAIETTSPGLVLDPFMGSGSTLVAAKAAGRRAIGIEKSEPYCEIAAKRLAQGSLFGAIA